MFDVIVIGAGHAGVEAALAAGRRGAQVALVTFEAANIGMMSCNPSIGGVGKGHIVREIDAFDGIMAVAADQAAIHYRLLNRSKGAAVQGPRVQADRRLYRAAMQAHVSASEHVQVVEAEVEDLVVTDGRIAGVRMADGSSIRGSSVVLATGTFLGARMFRGFDRETGGRIGERSSRPLAHTLRQLGLPTARLKTGTPPRLDGRTIDWALLQEQASDAAGWTFSPVMPNRVNPQLSCALARTTAATHDVIRRGLTASPLVSGDIEGQGPRYCPSIEDKVQRFGDRDGHQIFLEPEGLDDHVVYPNGISTSLSAETQMEMVASIAGLERARIVAPGYAVEYDYLDPRMLSPTLESRLLPGLFCAGQVNGTTGYEEAAGQGLIAGLNAAACARDLEPVVLDRASSYLGVMIDDLVLQGITEPYRMLTARAEYRLSLRADNAETRLGQIAEAAGCLSEKRLAHQRSRREALARLRDGLDRELSASEVAAAGGRISMDGSRRTAWDWLRLDGVELAMVTSDTAEKIDPAIAGELVEDARYAPYVERQMQEVTKLRSDEALPLPDALDYSRIPGLSAEMIARLGTSRPTSIAAASRIRGITPAALTAVLLHVRKLAA